MIHDVWTRELHGLPDERAPRDIGQHRIERQRGKPLAQLAFNLKEVQLRTVQERETLGFARRNLASELRADGSARA